MGLGGVAIAVSPYVIHPKTAVLGRAGGGVHKASHPFFCAFFERKKKGKAQNSCALPLSIFLSAITFSKLFSPNPCRF